MFISFTFHISYSPRFYVSRNPVIRKIKFRNSLKSLPFRTPPQTESVIIFPATRRPTMTCGGTNSPSSPLSSAQRSHAFRGAVRGMLTGSEQAIAIRDWRRVGGSGRSAVSWWSISRNTTSDSWNSSSAIGIMKVGGLGGR